MPNNKQNGTTRKGANVNANKFPSTSQSDTEFASEQNPGTGSVTKLPSRKG
ncbi:hypothetical protein [Cohnella sp. 56]|uniref:hypothetical protein n=1 Tax=Cohnella sp. 56 TaxID=3113722 RepID=UPI0030E8280E